jgi:hypothetical protein
VHQVGYYTHLWTIKNAEMLQTVPLYIAVFHEVIPSSVSGAINQKILLMQVG